MPRARPHLVCTSDGMTILIEGERGREVCSPRLGDVLERVLGRRSWVPVEACGLLDAAGPSFRPVVLAPSTSADALVALLPDDAQVAVSGARPPGLGPSARRDGRAGTSADVFAGAGTAEGTGAFDHLAAARAIGATHLLIGVGSAHWLRRCPDLAVYLAGHASIAAANEAGVLWALPTPPPPGGRKLFCIGLNKTGTSSLHVALDRTRVPQPPLRPWDRAWCGDAGSPRRRAAPTVRR